MFVDELLRKTGATLDGIRTGNVFLQTACEEGIVTLADDCFFVGLVLLYLSVQQNYPVPIVCFDGGLTEAQRLWAAENMPACLIRKLPETDEIRQVRDALQGATPNLTEAWRLWICPMLIAASPFRRTLWVDCDLIALRPFGKLFQLIDDGPVFTAENYDRANTANKAELYDLLPIERQFDREQPLINAGVSGWDIERDAELLGWYQYPVLRAASDPSIRAAIRWHDQGSLIWALQKTGNEHRVLAGFDWNRCARHTQDPSKAYSVGPGLFDDLRADYPTAKLVHWNGFKVTQKLAGRLGPEAAVLDALRGMLPGPGYLALSDPKPKRRINLISYFGVKTELNLVRHFLDHYTRLGVDRFLVTLHGKDGDPRLADMRRLLSSRGITPVSQTPIYSAAVKHGNVVETLDKYCNSDDWVLLADVDELQIFPEPLPQFLERCESQGYAFIRGQMIDRVAEHGRLPTIDPDASLWMQFPYSAPVTPELTGGWVHKVCVHRGWLRPGEGGSHCLSYDVDKHRNYATTYRDMHGYPIPVEIHHFKWDASLVKRTEEKIYAIGGDLDSLHGLDFIDEYRSLHRHLKKHGRVNIAQFTHIGQPILHYIRGTVEMLTTSLA